VLRKLRGFSHFNIYSLTDYIYMVMLYIGNISEEIVKTFYPEILSRKYQL